VAKPSSLPVWATDSLLASGTQSGQTTKLTPSAGEQAQGAVPGTAAVGRFMNWVLNLLYQWVVYLNLSGTDELTYANTRTRVKLIPLAAGVFSGSGSGSYIEAENGVTLSSPGTVSVGWRLPLELPHGATLTGVRAGVDPDNATSSGNMQLIVLKVVPDKSTTPGAGTTTTLATVSSSGTAAQRLATSALTESIDRELAQYELTVTSTTTAAASDVVRWVEVTFTETVATGNR
jgi:hypothetical protein